MLRELRPALIAFVVLWAAGTIGLRWIEDWTWLEAFWMTTITLTTIGFGEVRPLSPAGRWFVMALIFGGVGVGTIALTQVTQYVVSGNLAKDLENRRRRLKMSVLRDHIVVVGFGRLGREVAQELVHAGETVVVVDPDPIPLSEAHGIELTLQGDGSSDSVLLHAGLDRARGVAIATPSSALNVYITLSARQLNPRLYIVVRVDDREAEGKAVRAGANAIVSPFAAGGSRMAHALRYPEASSFFERALGRHDRDLAVEDVAIAAGSRVVGRLAVVAPGTHYRVTVVAIRKPDGGVIPAPQGEQVLAPGDVVVVVGRAEDVSAFKRAAELSARG